MIIDSALIMYLHPAFMPLLYDYFMKCFRVFYVYNFFFWLFIRFVCTISILGIYDFMQVDD